MNEYAIFLVVVAIAGIAGFFLLSNHQTPVSSSNTPAPAAPSSSVAPIPPTSPPADLVSVTTSSSDASIASKPAPAPIPPAPIPQATVLSAQQYADQYGLDWTGPDPAGSAAVDAFTGKSQYDQILYQDYAPIYPLQGQVVTIKAALEDYHNNGRTGGMNYFVNGPYGLSVVTVS